MQDSIKRKIIEISVPLVVIFSLPLVWVFAPRHHVVVYDCNLAEISPDYPVDVKNECRKAKVK